MHARGYGRKGLCIRRDNCSDGRDSRVGTPPVVVPPEPEPLVCSGTEAAPERLYLQQLGIDRVIIKWREDMEAEALAESVCFGTDMNALLADSETQATVTATGHREVELDPVRRRRVRAARTVRSLSASTTASLPPSPSRTACSRRSGIVLQL